MCFSARKKHQQSQEKRGCKMKTLKSIILSVTTLIIIGMVSSCASHVNTTDEAEMRVATSVAPVGYLAARIGGEKLQVDVLLKSGQSPHTFEPSPKQIAAISSGQIYFTVGLPFEKTMEPKLKSANRNMLIVDALKGQSLITHDDHLDPHVWMAPGAAIMLAEVIHEELVSADPSNKEAYDAGLTSLKAELETLDKEARNLLEPMRGKNFFTLHPAYGYFAAAYGLNQISIEQDGKEPGQKTLAEIIDLAKRDSAKIIFVQPQISDKGARTIAETVGASLVMIDPLRENCISSVRELASEISKSFAINQNTNKGSDNE